MMRSPWTVYISSDSLARDARGGTDVRGKKTQTCEKARREYIILMMIYMMMVVVIIIMIVYRLTPHMREM